MLTVLLANSALEQISGIARRRRQARPDRRATGGIRPSAKVGARRATCGPNPSFERSLSGGLPLWTSVRPLLVGALMRRPHRHTQRTHAECRHLLARGPRVCFARLSAWRRPSYRSGESFGTSWTLRAIESLPLALIRCWSRCVSSRACSNNPLLCASSFSAGRPQTQPAGTFKVCLGVCCGGSLSEVKQRYRPRLALSLA